nr:putative ATPase [Marseillevirus futianmevirus]
MTSSLSAAKAFLKQEFGISGDEIVEKREDRGLERLVHLSVPKYDVSISWYSRTEGTEKEFLDVISDPLKRRILGSQKFNDERNLHEARISRLEKQVEELKELVRLQSEKITELEYAPGGPRAEEARLHFESLLE